MTGGGSPRSGALVLVPNTLDLGAEAVDLTAVLPLGVLQRAATLGHWVAENAKTTRAFLKRVDAVVPLAQPLQAIEIRELPRAPKGGATRTAGAGAWRALLQPALQGHDVGLISEAGLPAVADPGAELVAAAHELGLDVQPLPGASALLLALAASGLHGQSFAFVGYLPVPPAERAERLRALEQLSRRQRQTQLLIETPYRNEALLHTMLQTLADDTRLSISCGLTLPNGWSRTRRVAQWRREPVRWPAKVPAVFGLLG